MTIAMYNGDTPLANPATGLGRIKTYERTVFRSTRAPASLKQLDGRDR